MKKILLVALCSLLVSTAFAQRENQKWYASAAGFRTEVGGSSNNLIGIFGSHFFKPRFAMDAMATSNFNNIFEGTIIARYVAALPNIDSHMRWYIGGGWRFAGKPKHDLIGNRDGSQFYSGPSITLGFGYGFEKAPINICVDWRPTWNVVYTKYVKNNANDESLQVAVIGVTVVYTTRDKVEIVE